ncbi:HAD family hydrolase [Legionella bononiensis]|uniref:HAD family hydrolase n=1 Tax=Legionella bononiensis TaxID=2793102 RepID=A0ABS1WD95_9GAMM|nr:HAD family hydrolase [Legionella bononiensis]MBL7527341.1 HAD family hydrolase [Legionella bononiensis]
MYNDKLIEGNPKKPPSSNVSHNRALATRYVLDAEADRTYYLRSTVQGIGNFISTRASELYNTLAMTFSLDSMDFTNFKKYIWPVITSGAALVIGDYVMGGISEFQTGVPEYDFIYKFFFGAAILGYCAMHRITEREFKTTAGLSAAVASEVVAITYLYSSIFSGTRMMIGNSLSDGYAFVTSLGTSALVVPSSVAFLTQKLQDLLVRYQYSKGAQRSDTAVISSGLTPLSNLYFQLNHFLVSELMSSSRMFQLGLISHNILNAERIVQKFRNLPALLADLTPETIRKLLDQQKKLKQDYDYNNTLHKVLRFTPQGSVFVEIPRYRLRTGDLVYCDERVDLSSVPLSGELIALQRNKEGQFIDSPEQRKFSVNLRAQNGEDVWIEHLSKPDFASKYTKVDLHAIHDGKQAGVLVGDKLNLYGNDNMFIQIKPEKELLLSGGYEKKSVINQIVAERKQRSVLHSILASIIMAGFLQRDIITLPAESLRLMFTLFQTMIPFSEAFLRDAVNSRLMKKLNKNMEGKPFETIDALRVVDLCNALGGYYHDRFPNGVAIISDKTGTLTTTKMDVLGLWAMGMPEDVQQLLKEKNDLLLPKKHLQMESFEVFASAYTNNKKELEPEEHAILELFKTLIGNEHCLQVSILGNNRFKKTIMVEDKEKEIETFHLGLYRTFGGRITLVDEGNNHYLVFCGVPKQEVFNNTALLQHYAAMQSRKGVLSRDWCIARSPISEQESISLKQLFDEDNKKEIEAFILNHPEMIKNMQHYVTFIIDNPVKKGAEHFIGQCREIHVPVFVATGDTTKAAENIARVLCPAYAKNILSIRADKVEELDLDSLDEETIPPDSTVIYSGINPVVLSHFKHLLTREKAMRPVIIFAEMSTEGKGILARFLKDNQFFVVANGDGTNDVMMMKNSDVVIAHYSDDNTFAPGVDSLSNISDEQLRHLFGSKHSFYELFDIHLPDSLFMQQFTPLANSQEKPSLALALKSGKMSFDLVHAVGVTDVKEMYQQHWFSVAFDLMWLWIAFYEINQSTDLPMDNQNISASRFITQSMGIVMLIAVFQSLANYALAGESTNLTTMLLMLSILPIVLKSIFSGFRMVQERLYPAPELHESEEIEETPTRSRGGIMGYLGTLFRPARQSTNQAQSIKDAPQL